MNTKFLVSFLVTATIFLTGCIRITDAEKNNYLATGGIHPITVSSNCVVVTNLVVGGLHRVIVVRPDHDILAGFSAKPLPVGSKVSWTTYETHDSVRSAASFVHIVELEQ